jgi:formylglycine-generating enzyme required for sulfatase activity
MGKKLILLLIAVAVFSCGCSKEEQENLVLVAGNGAVSTGYHEQGQAETISDFYIGKYEVTQKEWADVMGNNPSGFQGDNLPVEMVSWYDAIEYCNKRSEKEGLAPYYSIDRNNKDPENKSEYDDIRWIVSVNVGASGYRLPTETEWVYAASGGLESKNYTFSGSNDEEETTWYFRNAGKEYISGDWDWSSIESNRNMTHPVGSKKPNELGIYDMSGNVREWCDNWYQDLAIGIGVYRVWKGGGWIGDKTSCQISYRGKFEASGKGADMGLRVCRNK